MRNIITVVIAGSLLCGCLTTEETSFTGDSAPDTVGNNAPTITGTPPKAVMSGNSYQFVPDATDADGDSLTLTVQNAPGWVSFDASSGRLSGRPTLVDVGVYSNIIVSVSDSMDSASLPKFGITVSQTALGSITVNLTAPTENMDGSALTDHAGYTIYYGSSPGYYDEEIRIDNPSVTVYVVEELPSDTYYFAATAYNSSGNESPFSEEIVRTVN